MKAKTKITKEDLMNIEKSARRKTMIEAGVYNIHKNKSFKSKKEYTRKDKHRKSLSDF